MQHSKFSSYTLLFFAAILLASCSGEHKSHSKEIESSEIEVHYFGALKNMMHEGDLSAKFDLNELSKMENLYAIGAFENLKGEIQIFDSQPFNTSVKDSMIDVDHTYTNKAALIVYSIVENWDTYTIPENIHTYKQLEEYVATIAEQHNINTEEPFPFLFEGEIATIDWHVINWKDGDTEHSHEKHINSGLNGTERDQQVELLGFYSNSHHAIFTHHTTNMHIHMKTDQNKLAGHVDNLTLKKGGKLKLPASN